MIRRTPLRRSRTMGQAKRTSQRKVTPQKRADAAFSLYIRTSRAHCEDDRAHVCRGRLECAHGHERGHLRTRYLEDNVFALCQGAHFYYSLHPLLWDEFMRRKQGDAYEDIRQLALMAFPVRLDYGAIAAQYQAKLRDLEAA